jgi:hypothetical protein
MKTETHAVKEIRITTDVIKSRCAEFYKKELIQNLEDMQYRTSKEYLEKFISVSSKEHENDLAHHVVSETEVVLTKEQLDFLRKNKESHVAVINEDGEHIALFPHRDLSY